MVSAPIAKYSGFFGPSIFVELMAYGSTATADPAAWQVVSSLAQVFFFFVLEGIRLDGGFLAYIMVSKM